MSNIPSSDPGRNPYAAVDERWLAALADALGADRDLGRRFHDSIPAGYDELNAPATAAADLRVVASLLDAGTGGSGLATSMVHLAGAAADEWRFRVYRRESPIALADMLPLLDQLGLRALDERAFRFAVDGGAVHVHDVGVRVPVEIGSDAVRAEVCRAFEAQFHGEIELDGFNRLVLAAGLSIREVEIVRAYARYMRQTAFPFSQQYVEAAVVRHPAITRLLVTLFTETFDPARASDARARAALRDKIVTALDAIPSLDDDRTMRSLLALIEATSRTNVFRPGAAVIAFKLDPSRVPDLPLPRPMFEIWVCSPRVEGVHLRGGRIARGGIRWSDRPEDFRTEVLGLMKAQMVKNAVIVPTGSKGGFVVKRPLQGDDLRAEGLECYRLYIAGLLDVTDNLVGGEVVPPPSTVRLDGDDPYLVVAADKGTASFSDVANSIALDRGFWLGDAFASGGSAGYDHKEMGITARGAWESVRRHARVLGKDADRDPLTTVGIGDMSGDVFGNGMLRSPHLLLVAAFDHRHVFCDPSPDPARSYAERRRLFELPRSSWDDYDRTVLSPGGGIYPRTAKSVDISPQMAKVLGTATTTFTPAELISAVLRAPVDLLWNGGIGTYVRASTESNAEVGDRTNDPVRVAGSELRCRMVAEGGNLGFTQRGRVEYSLAGGLINTDAIDNSAGVDCSDHEVNLKILLAAPVREGVLLPAERDALLEAMTAEVAELVLDDNRSQTLALAMARAQARPLVGAHARYLDALEAEGWINRPLEFLPTDKQIAERQAAGMGLSTPEFAVLLAYTKTTNIELITDSDLPDDPHLHAELMRYFPSAVRSRFADAIAAHPLRREIVATQVGNQMVNMSGISFDHRLLEATGASVVDTTRAWVVGRDVLGITALWDEVEGVEGAIGFEAQLDLLLDLRRMLERSVPWILRHHRPPFDIGGLIATYRPGVVRLVADGGAVLRGAMRDRAFSREAGRLASGVPEDLAQRASMWPLLHTAFDVVDVARRTATDVVDVAAVYWEVFEAVDIAWLWDAIGALPRTDRWNTQARSAARDDLLGALAAMTEAALDAGSVGAWAEANGRLLSRTAQMFTELKRIEVYDLTAVTVALRQLRNLLPAAVL